MASNEAPLVMVVEDDVGVATLERRRLERAGYRVVLAASAVQAMERLREGGVALIVLDHRLPDGEGLDLYEQMKSAGFDLPVIVVTGSSDEAVVIRALRSGIRDFVAKSAQYLDYLPTAVRRVLHQVHLETELVDSKAQLAGVIGSALDGIMTVNSEGEVTLFNHAAERLFGCAAADAIGQPLTRFIPESDAGMRATVGVRSDGQRFPIEASNAEMLLQGRTFRTIIVRDVTERHRAEEDREKLVALIQNSSDLVALAGLDERVLFLNAGGRRMVGLPGDEDVSGRSIADFYGPEEYAETIAPAFEAVRTRGRWDGAGRLRRFGSGGTVDVEISAFVVRRERTGEPLCLATVQRDVTRQRKLELESKLAFRERMASVGTLAAGVAHEVNNPLAYVSVNLQCIAEDLRLHAASFPKPQLTELEAMVADARQGVERVQKIMGGLKTISRADEERRTVVDLKAVIELSISMTHNEIRHRARLVRDLGPVPFVLGDEGRLGQVLINLLINAVQAIPEGRADENEIRVLSRTDAEGRAILEVRDTGSGIAPAILGRIFDPFFTTKPVGVGTGLGLWICHGIVSTHGGELSVESEPGRGTVFRIALPPAECAALADTRGDVAPLSDRRRGTVLVVDDDAMVGMAIRRGLKRHSVSVLQSANDALELIASGARFDVILCDLMMPDVTGMEFHQRLSALRPDVLHRVVFVTGGAFTPAAREFLEQIPNERVAKPFDMKGLRALVCRFIA